MYFVCRPNSLVIYKQVAGVFVYDDFKSMLQVEGVRSCLPHLDDGDIDGGVKLYHSLRNGRCTYEELAKKHKVVAFRLRDVIVPPIEALTLTRRQESALAKILTGWC